MAFPDDKVRTTMSDHRKSTDRPAGDRSDRAPQDRADDLPETDRKSKAPHRPADTDAEGNAHNDIGEDNHPSGQHRSGQARR